MMALMTSTLSKADAMSFCSDGFGMTTGNNIALNLRSNSGQTVPVSRQTALVALVAVVEEPPYIKTTYNITQHAFDHL